MPGSKNTNLFKKIEVWKYPNKNPKNPNEVENAFLPPTGHIYWQQLYHCNARDPYIPKKIYLHAYI